MVWLIFERLFAIAILALVVVELLKKLFVGAEFTLLEWTIAFVLCNIWMATIDMRGDQ